MSTRGIMMATYKSGNKTVNIYGLETPRDEWLTSQLQSLVDISPNTVDGLSIQPKGVNGSCELVVEIHGNLTASQLRCLADAIDNVPTS